MLDNIGQAALLTFNTSRWNAAQLYQLILLCINCFIVTKKGGNVQKKKVVFRDYLIIKLVLGYWWETQKYQITKLERRAKLSRFFQRFIKFTMNENHRKTTDRHLRAICCKDQLRSCKIEKTNFLKLCQSIGLGELFLKIQVSGRIDFYLFFCNFICILRSAAD